MRFEAPRKTAAITGVPEYRIRQMIKEGSVPGFYAGKKYLINIDAFIVLINQMCDCHQATVNAETQAE